MKHFFKMSKYYTPKNKLQAAFVDKMKEIDNTLIENLEDFRSHLQGLVSELNEKHPNCQNLNANFHPIDTFTLKPTDGLTVPGLFYSEFHPVKHSFPEAK